MKKRYIIPVCIILFAVISCVFVYLDNVLIKTTRYTVKSDEIPKSFDGYKIIQLSDIHGKEFGENNSILIEKIYKSEPDIILITGDIVNNSNDNSVEVFENIMSSLNDCAPMYAVTGNHDKWDDNFDLYIEKWQKEYNITYLENKSVPIEINGEKIYLSGITDPDIWNGEECERIVDEYKNMMNIEDGFNMLMFHRADMLNSFIDSPYDIVFSGHIHGGQWRVPFIGGVISPDMVIFPEYSGGMYERGEHKFFVSCGVGNPQNFPGTSTRVPRIFNMAEIVEVTLKTNQ